ncbi:hypothetical protein ABMY26_34010 [Azospirillum sp. HJ39]|uniref:hypothetical protein n=1 Tax=Azospirillum sp. HJ39 TaxID=3159496 RepID=UPI00355732A5
MHDAERAHADVESQIEMYRRQRGWKPELGLLGGTAAVLGGVALLGGPLGPVAAGLLLFPTLAIGDEVKDALEQRRENRVRRDLEVSSGLRRPMPTLRERLSRLLGRAGELIAERAKLDLGSGIWSRTPGATAYYEFSAVGARPVSPQRAQELRATSPNLTQVSLRPQDALVSRYLGGRLAGQDGGPAAIRLDTDGKVVGAGWVDARRVVRSGLTTPDMRQFRPNQAAEAILASYRRPSQAREGDRREVAVDTMIWESRRLAEAVIDLRLPQREEDDLVQALRSIETSAIALRRLGRDRVVIDIGNPIDAFDLARKVGETRERSIEARRPAPGGR